MFDSGQNLDVIAPHRVIGRSGHATACCRAPPSDYSWDIDPSRILIGLLRTYVRNGDTHGVAVLDRFERWQRGRFRKVADNAECINGRKDPNNRYNPDDETAYSASECRITEDS